VNFLGSRDGLVHISELQQGRVGKTTDVVNVGDSVKVKVLGFDERGKVKLSMRVVDQATGADITEQVGSKPGRGDREHGDREPRGDRGDRGDRGHRSDRGDRGPPRERYEQSPMPQDSEQPVIGE
jgi:polyribonucleotide nucleotidyltransferase